MSAEEKLRKVLAEHVRSLTDIEIVDIFNDAIRFRANKLERLQMIIGSVNDELKATEEKKQ